MIRNCKNFKEYLIITLILILFLSLIYFSFKFIEKDYDLEISQSEIDNTNKVQADKILENL